MATIEPRLIHLLNESADTPRAHHASLPPMKGLALPDANSSDRLPPIELGAAWGQDVSDLSAPSSAQKNTQAQPPSQSQPASMPLLHSLGDDFYASGPAFGAGAPAPRNDGHQSSERPLPALFQPELPPLFDPGTDFDESPHVTKKRPSREDFVQLPQPQKKKKADSQSQAPPMFPPIIVGLNEPPPNANVPLFPPISFDEHPHTDQQQTPTVPQLAAQDTSGSANHVPEDKTDPSPSAEPERTPTGKVKRRAAKPRRKWSDEETNALLLGVSKHGVGRWTDILEDKSYNFNDRSAGDLKDRFRTCCPEELRAKIAQKKEASKGGLKTPCDAAKPKKGIMAENILNELQEDAGCENGDSSSQAHQDNSTEPPDQKPRKSRAHRKNMDDLAQLGINAPFKKSLRRERQPFSEQEDQEILQGFEKYGAQWTKIQRDPDFHLSKRQPTDLRDRLRNKYPERFASAEKTAMQVKESRQGNATLEPSVNIAVDKSFDVSRATLLESQHNRTNSKDETLRAPPPLSGIVESTENSQTQMSYLWGDVGPANLPEMDISRLLLDDTQPVDDAAVRDKRGTG